MEDVGLMAEEESQAMHQRSQSGAGPATQPQKFAQQSVSLVPLPQTNPPSYLSLPKSNLLSSPRVHPFEDRKPTSRSPPGGGMLWLRLAHIVPRTHDRPTAIQHPPPE